MITAGGAASIGKKSHRKTKKKRGNPKRTEPTADEQTVSTASSTPATLTNLANNSVTNTLENPTSPPDDPGTHDFLTLELEQSERQDDDHHGRGTDNNFLVGVEEAPSVVETIGSSNQSMDPLLQESSDPVKMEDFYQDSQQEEQQSKSHEILWLFFCFMGIMASFVGYGLLLEYTTSGGRKLHELSFLFVTSGLYTLTAAAGRYVRAETPTTIPPARFAILGLTSMGSTFCSVRSLR